MAVADLPPAIKEAIQLYRAGKQHESRDCLVKSKGLRLSEALTHYI